MFCPKCRCEYREGFIICSGCGVPLVEAFPVGSHEKSSKAEYENTDYELVLTTLGFTKLAQIKSIFDSEGIIYFIQGEDLMLAPGGLPSRVLVKKEQVEEVKQLLEAFDLL